MRKSRGDTEIVCVCVVCVCACLKVCVEREDEETQVGVRLSDNICRSVLRELG